MKTLHYRGLAGVVWNAWEFNPFAQTIVATLAFGSAKPVKVEVPVCSIARPRLGAFPISRRMGGWELASAAYTAEGFFEARSLHDDVPAEFYFLCGAPDLIEEELASL